MILSEKLKQDGFIPKILTFGSCLSRYTADRFSNLYGAWTISSIYHNRSDQFCHYQIDGNPQLNWSQLRDDVLRDMGCNDKAGDEDPEQIIRNQALSTMGLHNITPGLPVGNIKSGAPLHEILDQQDVDIILMDNHMDLGARIWVQQEAEKSFPFFMRTDYVSSFRDKFDLAPYLSAEQSATNNIRIAAYLKKRLPKAKIIFLHFPIDKVRAQERRINTTWEFVEALDTDIMSVVNPFYVNDAYHTNSASHFKPELYFALAGSVRALISE
jgi:hypothetical protein